MDVDNPMASSTVTINDSVDTVDIESLLASLPVPLSRFFQGKPKRAGLRTLFVSLRDIFEGDEKLKVRELWSTSKLCYVLAGDLAIKKKCYEARAVCLVATFLQDLAVVVPPTVEEFMEMGDSMLRSKFKIYYHCRGLLNKHDNRDEMMKYLGAVISMQHPRNKHWEDSFKFTVFGEAPSQKDDVHYPSWITVTILGQTGIKYHIEITDTVSLNVLLDGYASDCSIPLKECRQVYNNDRTLFTDISGEKTLRDLGFCHGCVVKVGYQKRQQSKAENEAKMKKQSKSKNEHKTPKECFEKKRSGHKSTVVATGETAMMKLKEEHSKALGFVLDEARDKFERIRRDLNNLEMKRTNPKKRGVARTGEQNVSNPFLASAGDGGRENGKAGRTVYPILVGEKANLYKSGKGKAYKSSTNKVVTLDLHGRSRNESLELLNGSVEKWVDMALKGDYPYVLKVDIVCGGGCQTLSEAVKGWISQNKKVAMRRTGHV